MRREQCQLARARDVLGATQGRRLARGLYNERRESGARLFDSLRAFAPAQVGHRRATENLFGVLRAPAASRSVERIDWLAIVGGDDAARLRDGARRQRLLSG